MTNDAETRPLASRRPGVTGAVCIAFGVLLLALGGAAFWGARYEPTLVGSGLVAVALGLLAFLLGGFGVHVARSASPRAAAGPVLLLTILTVAIGFVGNGITAVVSALGSSTYGLVASLLLFVVALSVALQGALIHGAAKTL